MSKLSDFVMEFWDVFIPRKFAKTPNCKTSKSEEWASLHFSCLNSGQCRKTLQHTHAFVSSSPKSKLINWILKRFLLFLNNQPWHNYCWWQTNLTCITCKNVVGTIEPDVWNISSSLFCSPHPSEIIRNMFATIPKTEFLCRRRIRFLPRHARFLEWRLN